MPKPGMHTGQEAGDDLNFAMSEKAKPLFDAVVKFIREEVEPMQEKFYALGENRPDRWDYAPGQLDLLEATKAKAKAAGLWNFFLPNAETGEGLSNLDYAYIAVELGKVPLASECLNCSAPDTGNMEVLEKVGTPEQKKKWLEPLLKGEIRSAYAMTEPGVASSDAKNIQTRAELVGNEWVINGEKYYISGAGDPRCKIMITMVKTNPNADTYKQQSQILVPIDAPGVEIVGPMEVFGQDDAPHGHMHIRFTDVRVPKDNLVGAQGGAFKQTMRQLEHERGGIDRLVSNYALYKMALERADLSDPRVRQEVASLETGYRIGRILVIREVLRQAPAGFSAATKCFCTEHEQRVAQFVAKTFGLEATLWSDVTAGLMYGPGYTIMGGTSNVMRNILGERVLGLPKEPGK